MNRYLAGPTKDKVLHFSDVPTSTYKWGVISGATGAFTALAWAKTRKQAIEFANRHCLFRGTWGVARLVTFDGGPV